VVHLAPQARPSRDAVIEALFAAGIGCSVHYIPLHLHPYWRERYHLSATQFPRSQAAYEASISLPLYSRMGAGDVQRVARALQEALRA
jgi:dTDP-4-amino-4,6-dideoxygalactose transaminase